LIVLTTSPPAITAQKKFQAAAIKIACLIVIVLEPTAGHTLLATSFAPILIAIYNQIHIDNAIYGLLKK
jgi:hypothetical protein